ncbi:MAG: hypothetical protein P1V51_17705 [Deltaproteobacteria bacterium]|nr:hypothetical protein [Deltaproteobacteria bacterium]
MRDQPSERELGLDQLVFVLLAAFGLFLISSSGACGEPTDQDPGDAGSCSDISLCDDGGGSDAGDAGGSDGGSPDTGVPDGGGDTCGDGVCGTTETVATCALDCVGTDQPPTCTHGCTVVGDCMYAQSECVNGICYRAECTSAADCTQYPNQDCLLVNGRMACQTPCTPGGSECDFGQACTARADDGALFCTYYDCVDDSDCSGEVCVGGVCGCNTSGDCGYPSDPVCNNGN